MRNGRLALVCLALALTAGGVHGQESPPLSSTTEELLEQERLRSRVEEAFNLFWGPADSGGEKNDNMVEAAGMLVEIGADAVPYVADELRQDAHRTFPFCAYALGRIGNDEAVAALREAVRRAEEQPRDSAKSRKAWACYGLGLAGQVDAVDLFNEGHHQAADVFVHFDTSMLEMAALFTAPESIPRLHAQLERFAQDEERRTAAVWTLRALRRIGDPSSVPALLATLDSPRSIVRREATSALGVMETPEAVAGVMRSLGDPQINVRFAAAVALEQLLPQEQRPAIVTRLQKEEDPNVRGVLYRVIARMGGPAAYDDLAGFWGRENNDDRRFLVEALRILGDPRAVAIYRDATDDVEARVALLALYALADVGGREATRVLLDEIDSLRSTNAVIAIAQLVRLEEPEAGPPIAARLLGELAVSILDPVVREEVYSLGDALAGIGYHQVLDDLRAGTERQRDATLVRYLDRLIARLEALRDAGDDVTAWVAHVTSPVAEQRLLAYDRLGRIGGPEAAKALISQFGRVDVEEGRAIMRAVSRIDAEPVYELLERVLTHPAFDGARRGVLREEAAWAASQLGGQRMLDALRRAVERRDGRDGKVFLYYANLAGQDALPLLRGLRVTRLRYLKWTRSVESDRLDRAARDIVHGRPLELDRPPDELPLRRED